MILDTLLSLVAPHECIGCNDEGVLICDNCQLKLQPARPKCYKCQNSSPGFATCAGCRPATPLSAVYTAVLYTGLVKDMVWKLKFGRARAAAREIAGIVSRRLGLGATLSRLPAASLARIVVVPAPTANSRARQRGYDQAALIAQSLARRHGLVYRPLLRRRGSQKQMGASREQRAAQLQGAFYAVRPAAVRGKHIILVDDVVTTGATLEAAAVALTEAGARRVDAITFAQA